MKRRINRTGKEECISRVMSVFGAVLAMVLLFFSFMLLLAGLGYGRDIYVPEDYELIQDAIDDALPGEIFWNNDVWGNGQDYVRVYPEPTGMQGNISLDPIFTRGPLGSYYLAQESEVSPAVDAGHPDWLPEKGKTTSPEHTPDKYPLDLGYHYPAPYSALCFRTADISGENSSILPFPGIAWTSGIALLSDVSEVWRWKMKRFQWI